MATRKRAIKKAVKKVAKAAKTAKSAKPAKAVKSAKKKVAAVKTKAKATAGTVRAKAKKLVGKLKHVQHDAAEVAMRIGSTMETIGGAVMSLVKPSDGNKTP
jgi:hypothetical protein